MRQKPKGDQYRYLTRKEHRSGHAVIVYDRTVRGKRYKLSTETSDWKEAAEWRAGFEAEKNFPARAKMGGKTFGDCADLYLAGGALRSKRQSVQDDYRRLLEDEGPVREHFGQTELADIDAPALYAWWSSLDLAWQTKQNYLSAVAVVFRTASKLGYVVVSPVPAFRDSIRDEKPAEPHEERVFIPTLAKVQAFARASEALAESRKGDAGWRDHVAVLLALDAALRIGEIEALEWAKVDLPGRRLLIDVSCSRQGAELGPTKSGKPRRVWMSKRLQRALGEWKEHLGIEAAREGARVCPGFHRANLGRRQIEPARKAAKIGCQGLSAHGLRHTYATLLLSAGFDLNQISKQLGHGSVSFTERTYARWLPEDDGYIRPPDVELPCDALENHTANHTASRSGVTPSAK